MDFSRRYLNQAAEIASQIDAKSISAIVAHLVQLRARGGRLFLLGVGGSAANCSHAVNDFRKLAGIEAYTPVDNVSELTARTNDEGWETVFESWIRTSRGDEKDALMIFSVGGGSPERGVSVNLARAIDEAKRRKMTVLGVVGRDGGYTKQMGDEVLVVPVVDDALITPHTESFQAVIWHCIISHPELLENAFRWEGLTKGV